ncbi:GATOR complex protein WDR59 isoform X2 [Ischnura elegans]|uniref:GATOR complex protein WDR59 isoform X2 n=1 Tax=Ischnura elegans TaxID=197161 RepID=UPI001ED8BB16|nr:GATOR complex protein WDR59 isoform X2 [Ischnura elegans]
MARWNNDFVVAEHRDVQACAMGVDYSGDFALLAGYKCLALVCLEDPTEIVRTISRPYKDDVKILQWNQTSESKELCALSNNHRVEILRWRLGEGVGCIGEMLGDQISLDSHSRAVSGLDWHKVEPNIIASGSGDGWLHVWDIRDHRYPSMSFSSVAFVTQVRWNRVNGNLIASAHDGDIRLWDRRKNSSPLNYITAHVGEIHDLDWSTNRESELVTCGGQDCTVRFFNVWRPDKPKAFLATASPVWRARHAPFGEGLVTSVSSSQQQKESSGNVLLWRRCRGGEEGTQESRSKQCSSAMTAAASPARRHSTPAASPLHTISSHTDIVLDFQWRKNREDPTNYELVTWSMDQILGIWRIDPMFQKLCGYEPDVESLPELPDCYPAPEISVTVPQNEVEELSSSVSKEMSLKKDVLCKSIDDRINASKEEGETGHVLNGVCSEGENHATAHHSLPGNEPSSPSTVVWETKAKLVCRLESASEEEVGAEAKADECTPYGESVAETTVTNVGQSNVKYELETVPTSSIDPPTASCASHAPSGGPSVIAEKQQHAVPNQSAIPLPPPLPHLTPPVLESSTPYGGGFQDSFVPFPQTSGARFSSSGFLVCFARPSPTCCPWSTTDVVNNSNGSAFSSSSSTSSTASYAAVTAPVVQSTPTPRSLSALGGASIGAVLGVVPTLSTGNTSSIDHHHHSAFCSSRDVVSTQKSSGKSLKTGHSMRLKAYGNKDRGELKSGAERGSARGWALVTIYDASKLLFLHRELGEQYVFDPKDVPGMCMTNASVAGSVGRKDLVQMWTLASLSASCFLAHRNQSGHSMLGAMSRALSGGNWMGITSGLLEDEEEQRPSLEEDLTDSEEDIPWSHHPLGRPFIESMISYYASQYDLQTAAMLCCAFGNQNELQPVGEKKKSYGISSGISSNKSVTISPGGSPYHTVHPGGGIGGVGVGSESGTSEGWLEGGWGALAPILKQNRSNSWSDSLDDMRSAAAAIVEHREGGGRATHNPRLTPLHHIQHQIWQGGGMLSTRGQFFPGYRDRNILTLDNSKRLLYDEYKNEYSEILNRWHLLESRAQVLKYVSVPLEPHRGVEFLTDCQHCSRSVRGAHCSYCKRLSLLCVICHVSVRGCSNFCLICGHGGHTHHIQNWFKYEDSCPSGCGCKCTEQSAAILD